MAAYKNFRPSENWLAFVKQNVRADFETGLLFWKIRLKGRQFHKPLGCKDSNGYIKISIARYSCYAHQVIYFLYTGDWPYRLLDHKDRNRSNNRPDNLEVSTHSKNALNSKLWNTNTTGAKGVSLTKEGRYKVTVKGKFYGYYDRLEKAREVANAHYQHG